MKSKNESPKAKKQPARRQPRATGKPVIEGSRTADDVRRAEELIDKYGLEHLRVRK